MQELNYWIFEIEGNQGGNTSIDLAQSFLKSGVDPFCKKEICYN